MSTPAKPEPRVGSLEWLSSLSTGERLSVAQVWATHADKALDSNPTATFDGTVVHLRWAVEELAKYVGHEPTIAEEMQYLSRCLDAVHGACDEAEKQATRWEHPLPVPEWVAVVREAATGERPDDPDDNRRRVYVDGKGNGWISTCVDEGVEYVVPVEPKAWAEESVDEIAAEHGGLREIGRCW